MIDVMSRDTETTRPAVPSRPAATGASPSAGVLLPAPTPSFTHRVDERDVLVTRWWRRSETEFAFDLDWSGDHCFFDAAPGAAHSEMLVAQTIRQTGLLVAHAGLGITRSHEFLMDSMRYETHPHRPTAGRAPGPMTATAVCVRSGRRTLDIGITVRHAGGVFLTSSSRFGWVSKDVYRRLRGAYAAARPAPAPAPESPALVGRRTESEVALAPAGRPGRWLLRGDTGNPALFDHAVDHVPGLVLAEAAHQAAYAFVGDPAFCPVSTAVTARQYVEFDAPCWIEAREVPTRRRGARAVEVVGVQRGRTTFSCVIEGVRSPAFGSGPVSGA